ncbi:MAG TPA: hypothetical protein VGE34_00205 [Candidatus Saccharimonadales bacterium]
MTHPTEKSFETNTQTPDFQAQIDAIMKRVLTPENINSYGDDALEDFVNVIETVKDAYDGPPLPPVLTGNEQEMAIMRYFKLNPELIEMMLDHIADVANNIDKLDGIIENLLKDASRENTPPDQQSGYVESGDGPHESQELIPRLKTILLMLIERYNIDVNPGTSSPEEFRIIPGRVSSNWKRKAAYHHLELPTLNRLIAVCDEEGNRTFVFDRDKVYGHGLMPGDIAGMTKKEMDALIENNDAIGKGIRYRSERNSFVKRLAGLIQHIPQDNHEEIIDETADTILQSQGRLDGRLTINEIAEKLGITYHFVKTVLNEIKAPSIEERIKNKPSPTYSADVLDLIPTHPTLLAKRGHPLPDGVMKMSQVATELGNRNLSHYARKYHMPLGKFAFDDGGGLGVFPHDVTYLTDLLDTKGLSKEAPQPGEYTIPQAAEKFNINEVTLLRRIAAKQAEDESFGKLATRKVHTMPNTRVISEEQLEKLELVRVEDAPNGIVSRRGLALLLKPLDLSTVYKVIDKMIDEGTLKAEGVWKFGANTQDGFRIEDEAKVRERILLGGGVLAKKLSQQNLRD